VVILHKFSDINKFDSREMSPFYMDKSPAIRKLFLNKKR